MSIKNKTKQNETKQNKILTKNNNYKNSTYSEYFPYWLKGRGILLLIWKDVKALFGGALKLLWALAAHGAC